MALGLLKQTVNNASGSFTPNLTLLGYFELSVTGPLVINFPTGLLANAQIFTMKFSFPLPLPTPSPVVTWDSDYVWPENEVPTLPSYFGVGSGADVLIQFFAADGKSFATFLRIV